MQTTVSFNNFLQDWFPSFMVKKSVKGRRSYRSVTNRPVVRFTCINILTWVQGFQIKIVNFMFLLSLNSEIRDFDTKKTTPNIEVCPDSLGAMLEYWYIVCGQLSPKNELRFLWSINCLNDIIRNNVSLQERAIRGVFRKLLILLTVWRWPCEV